MTYQSYTWALDQDIPGDAWRVFLALANRTEHRTGKVYFDQEEIVIESKISPNSLSKYLGALRRNGYLAEVKKGKEKHYWLLLDRDPTKSFTWDAAENAAESDEAPSPRLAPENAPARFHKAAQAEQRSEISAPPAGKPEGMHPVVTGSFLDQQWSKYLKDRGERRPFEMTIILKDGSHARGYYRLTPLPPKEEEQEQIAV